MAIVPNKVFVRNLPFSCTNDQLSELFGSHGPVKQCFVVKDENADRCKGFGFVTFASKDDTKKVLGKDIWMEKRKLHIFPANKKEEGPTRAKKNFTPRKNTPKKANKGMKDELEESDSEDKGTEKTDEKEDASSGEGEDKEDEEEEKEEKQKTERGKKRTHKDQSNLKQSNGSPPKKARKEIEEGATLEIRIGIGPIMKKIIGKTFLSFETKAAAEECLKMGNQEDSPLIMNGQNLEISRAVPPQRLNQSRQPETE
ncbi:putative RNA-binding protein 28, partial [Apostichopus japonicus]